MGRSGSRIRTRGLLIMSQARTTELLYAALEGFSGESRTSQRLSPTGSSSLSPRRTAPLRPGFRKSGWSPLESSRFFRKLALPQLILAENFFAQQRGEDLGSLNMGPNVLGQVEIVRVTDSNELRKAREALPVAQPRDRGVMVPHSFCELRIGHHGTSIPCPRAPWARSASARWPGNRPVVPPA